MDFEATHIADLNKILVEHKVESSQAAIIALLRRVFSGEVSVDDAVVFIDDLLQEAGLDESKALDVELMIYNAVLEPNEDELESLFDSKKILFSVLVDDLATKHGIVFEDKRMKRRFAHICEVYLKEEYDYTRAVRAFAKGARAGGMELEQDVADSIMDALTDVIGRVDFTTRAEARDQAKTAPQEGDVAAWLAEQKKTEVVAVPESPKKAPVKKVAAKSVATPKPVDAAKKQLSTPSPKKEASVPVSAPVTKKVPTKKLLAVKKVASKPVVASLAGQPKPVVARRSAKKVALAVNHTTVKDVAVLEKHDLLEADEHGNVQEASAKVAVHAEKVVDTQQELTDKVKETIAQSGLKYKDPQIDKRFQGIVVSRMKEVRGAYETRDAVMKSVAEGGLGMDVHKAQKFLQLLEAANDELHSTWSERERLKKIESLRQRRAKLFEGDTQATAAKVGHRGTSADVRGVVKKKPTVKRAPQVSDDLKGAKPMMQDVKAPPNLINPISELKSYTLEDFHRLDKDPVEAALKIEGKIRLLGQESFVRMKQGAAAWKQCEVMMIYKEQLQQSIVGNMSLAEVIVKRKENKLLILEEHEVEALLGLLTRLRS